MNCPRCQSKEIHRSRRRNFIEDVKASMGFWPFQCAACEHRFAAARRMAPPSKVERPVERTRTGPEMAFRCAPVKPMAKVVIEADDQVQLDQILLALHRAVSMHQQTVREEVSV